MAAALLARRNEPQWGDARLHMRNSYPNSNRQKPPLPKPNPNPNPTSVNASTDLLPPAHSEPPPATVPLSSFLDRCRTSPSDFTIDISKCSIKELRDLKRLLLADLALVRAALRKVESKEPRSSSRSSGRGTSHRKKQLTPNARRNKRLAAGSASDMHLPGIMGKCKLILTKLMRRNSSSSWFNQPVDVVGMKLPDYPSIVKNPMDLGTVKSKLYGRHYASPLEFAADVRLTFANARLYNPEGHVVNTFASQLLQLFEAEFGPVYAKYEKHLATSVREEEESQKMSKTKVRTMEDLLSKPDPPLQKAAEVGDKSPVRAETATVPADKLIPTVDEEEEEEDVGIGVAVVDHEEEEEDVDIGEDWPFENYPPVEVDKDSSGSSSSSSSGRDSSSSSGSGSGSSSGSDSDEDS